HRVYETRWGQIRGSNGQSQGVIGLATDVTETRIAEEALRQSEERYRVFVAQSSEGIYRIEYDPPISVHLSLEEQVELAATAGYIAGCNDSLARMYGLKSASEMIGRRVSEFISPNDSQNRSTLEKCITNGYRISEAETLERDSQGKMHTFRNSI